MKHWHFKRDLVENRFTLSTQKTLLKTRLGARNYYTPRQWERHFYERIGIRKVEKALIFVTGDKPAVATNYSLGSEASLSVLTEFESKTRSSERVHLVGSALSLGGLAVFAIAFEHPVLQIIGEVASASSFLLNTSFVLLQRYHRARIYSIFERLLKSIEKQESKVI